MTVISIPLRLKVAASTLLLWSPLVALEVLIVSRAPTWNLPYRQALYWAVAFGMICFPLFSWVTSLRKSALFLSGVLGIAWMIISVVLMIRMWFPPLGFFTVGLLAFLAFQYNWLRIELKRTFLDPQLAWYQGLPQAIPGLVCVVDDGSSVHSLQVSRLDVDGAFVFSRKNEGKIAKAIRGYASQRRLRLKFTFKVHQLVCQAQPTLFMERGLAMGLQFVEVTPDLKKEIQDFVEALRGEGHV